MLNNLRTFGFMLITFPLIAYGGKFSMTEYECSQMDAARDGFKCLINDDGELLIKIYISKNAPKEKFEKSKYLINVTRRNFMASGGKYIRTRNIHWDKSKSGAEMEQLCFNYKMSGNLFCNDRQPAQD